MFTKEKYCAVCGCPFSLPLIHTPETDPNEDELLILSFMYDPRVLPGELAWLTYFRVVGRWRNPHRRFKNVSDISDFFISYPAKWQYERTWDPVVPTKGDKEESIPVYERTDAENGMLFPIHQVCLCLVDLMCENHREQSQEGDTRKPRVLEEFCDCLESQRSANLDDSWKIMQDPYYGVSGGIEWPHQYFGARRFWTDEWDAVPGWELLCADPLHIPNLYSFILSELPEQLNPSQMPADHGVKVKIEWLSFTELEKVQLLDEGGHDWAEGIKVLKAKANSIGADEIGGEPRQEKLMSLVPLGLRNRWRIWKILEHISEEWSHREGLGSNMRYTWTFCSSH